MTDPAPQLAAALASHPFLILDGGLASELGRRGCDLAGPLWSSRALIDHPEAVVSVHLDYFAAGADCATTATYQASVPGLMASGLSRSEAEQTIRSAAHLARAAAHRAKATRPQLRPLVVASMGSFGARLANGAEYTGDFMGARDADIRHFHSDRMSLLSPLVDVIAFETIPSLREAELIAQVLADTPAPIPVWVSMTSPDGLKTGAGDPLAACARVLAPAVQGLGVNCCHPSLVADALTALGEATSLLLCAYPNGGDTWNPRSRCFVGEVMSPAAFAELAQTWLHLGARVIGGCCRTTPAHIAALARLRDRLEHPLGRHSA